MRKKLSELSRTLPHLFHDQAMDLEITGVTADSRAVQPGFVFVATQGTSQDGHAFLSLAEKQGAVLAIGQKEAPPELGIAYLQVKDSKQALAELAATLHGNPSHSMRMIGVTGTSGKTTTTYVIESILQAAGHQVGVIGTVNFRFGSKIYPSTHTTPGSVELQALLSQMHQEGCTAVVMEVSSHALKQRRTACLAFDAMVFTNLSPEHLDFHPTMEDYYQSKRLLFTELADYSASVGKKPIAVINTTDPYGKRLIGELKSQIKSPVIPFEFGKELEQLRVSLEGIEGKINGIFVQSKLTGSFNSFNLVAAVKVAQGLGVDPSAIQKGIENLPGVPGRLERVENPRGIHIWVDYAHKPDALEKVLKTLRTIRGNHRLITVFGCGGDRDRKKRPVMGKIAVENSDFVLITSDNPRTEEPMAIIQEILRGTTDYLNFEVEPDRKKAIQKAIQNAKRDDLILIAGKGHEDYQILGTQKIHFDDREIAAQACRL